MNTNTGKKAFRIFILQVLVLVFFAIGFIIVFMYLEPVKDIPSNTSTSILEGISDISSSHSSTITNSETSRTTSNEDAKKYISGEVTDKENSLEIGSISVDGKIVTGPKSNQNNLLLQGFWIYPDSGLPNLNSNKPSTPIIFGHRLYKKPPETETLYNLDKINEKDIIRVNYDKVVYYYEVISTKIIDKYDWASLEPEPFDAIKIVTCTPIDSFENAPFRILVTAKLIK